jgi:hypothetical protein
MKKKLFASVLAAQLIVTATVSALEITAWVPSWGFGACQTNLNAAFGTYHAKDALTSISLQFWVPTNTGGVNLDGGVSAANVAWFTNWGKTNNVKVILTVANGANGWDWNLATSAFATNRTNFVRNLVSSMTTYGLDGVDIDLEGNGLATNDHRTEYKNFIRELADSCHKRGKIVTVCTFAANGGSNCPDQSWWPDWAGKADFVRQMGYDWTYETNPTVSLRYSSQQNFGAQSGYSRGAITMGLAAWLDNWGGGSAATHVNECLHSCAQCAGVGMWDMQLGENSWKTSAVWALLAQLKACGAASIADEEKSVPEAKISPISIVRSSAGGLDIALLQEARLVSVFDLAGRQLATVVPGATTSGSVHIPLAAAKGVVIIRVVGIDNKQSVLSAVR